MASRTRRRLGELWNQFCNVGDHIFEIDAAITNRRFRTLKEARDWLEVESDPDLHEVYEYVFIHKPGTPGAEEFVDSYPGRKRG